MNKINKVLVVAPVPFFVDRGTPMRILEESLALERKGLKVDIVTYHLGRDIKDLAPESKIKIHRVVRFLFWYNKKESGPSWQKIILDMLLIVKVLRVYFKIKPDVIHAHLHEGVLIGWLVQKIIFWKKIKLVADFHGELVNEMTSHGYLNGGWLKKIFHFLEKIIFSMGDWTIASSGELKTIIRKLKKDDKIDVVLDGVNLERYNLKIKDARANTNNTSLTIIYSGAFVQNKGIDLLLEAILKISQKNIKDISFILAGGPVENISDFIKNNNLNQIVRVISPLDYKDLPEVNILGDIAIDPKTSQVGQASGKILQYMAAGLPVICFDRKNNRKYLEEAGYYVTDFSADGLVTAILYFKKNPDKIKTMSATSREMAKQFSWDKSAKEIIEVYQKI